MIVSVCGVGNFGYAVLKHLDNRFSDAEVELRAYDYDEKIIVSLQKTRKHPYLFKNISLSKDIKFVKTYEELATNADIIILAVSSDATRPAVQGLKTHLKKGVIVVNTAKALDSGSGQRLSQVITTELNGIDFDYAVFSGGTIAKDLFAHEPLGVDIASEKAEILPSLAKLFSADNLYVNTTTDLVGVELAGAFKNIISLLAGIIKGMGFSYGSETHIISVTAQAIADVCVEHYGAQIGTFSIGSQSWGNDMWMSATGNTRNREFGVVVGKNLALEKAISDMASLHKTVESLNTLQALKFYPELLKIKQIEAIHCYIHQKSISHTQLIKTLSHVR